MHSNPPNRTKQDYIATLGILSEVWNTPIYVRSVAWPTAADFGPGSQDPDVSQAAIAAISGLIPRVFITRVKL
jgi:hypothetical protein